MKIIEGLKKTKELQKKAEDLRKKIQQHAADLDFETPVYADQKSQISEWLQAHSDVLKEILSLRIAVQKTNLATEVEMEIGGKKVTKSIAEWVHRRRDLATEEMNAWVGLTDRGLKEGSFASTVPGGAPRDVKLRRYYDPKQRDEKIELYRTEPGIIDRTLEVTNAITDLIE